MRKTAYLLVAMITAAGTLVMGSCASDSPTNPPLSAITVTLAPGADTLVAVGQTRQLNATIRDAAGAAVTGRTVAWSSSASGVATVSTGGLVTAVANGGTTITATVDGVSAAAQVFVAQLVKTVTITPGNTGLAGLGLTQPFTAVARDSLGATVPTPRFLWISADPFVAVVDSLGIATSKHSGQTTITAAAQGIPGNAVLSVSQSAVSLAYRVAPPVATVAGEVFNRAVQVEIRDAGGAVVGDAQLPVTLTSSGGTLKGTTTVNAINGVASFSGLWLELTGATFALSAASSGLPAATSAAFAITPAAAAAVAFVQPPVTDTAGAHLGVSVRIRDRFGNTVTDATTAVRARLVANSAGGSLFGDSTASAVAGVATFTRLNLQKAGSGYTLRAAADELDSVTSGAFVVNPGHAHHLASANPYLGAYVNTPAADPLVVAIADQFSNLATSGSFVVSVALDTVAFQPAALMGTQALGSDGGYATFPDLRIDRPGSGNPDHHFSLTVTSPGLVGVNVPAYVALRPDRIASGGANSCAVSGLNGEGAPHIYCWGDNSSGQIGNSKADAVGDSVPLLVAGDLVPFNRLAIGGGHACVIVLDNHVWCWGSDGHGQLGIGGSPSGAKSPEPINSARTFSFISAGANHTCGIADDDQVYCWGSNADGQLGTGTAPDESSPVAIGSRTYSSVRAGAHHTCAIALADSAAYCWGLGTSGQLGQGATSSSTTPVLVTGGFKWIAVAAGDAHTCGIIYHNTSDPLNVYCWGDNASGQLGDGDAPFDKSSPVAVADSAHAASGLFDIAAGAAHTCVHGFAGVAGGVLCWGSNSHGQIGANGGAGSDVPVVAVSSMVYAVDDLSAGAEHTCIVAVDQNLGGGGQGDGGYCWGRNVEGQLGIGSRGADQLTAQRIVQ